MSVINKMLRDLDSRQVSGTVSPEREAPPMDLARGTLIVRTAEPTTRAQSTSHLGFVLAGTVAVLVGAGGTWWYLNRGTAQPHVLAQSLVVPAKAQPVVVPAVLVNPPVALPVPVPAPVPVPVPVPVPAPKVVAPVEASLKMDSTFRPAHGAAAKAIAIAAVTPGPAPVRSSNALAASVPPAPAPAAPTHVSRQSPALEALAQAQALWTAGSHAAAIDLLQDALAVAERAVTPAGNHPALASLARELARMEMAEGQVSKALAMLTRLEPALADIAEVWAMRGNAAQRLGRHPESVTAYLRALKLRPNEPRWMLGAAVSLAAQGETDAAADWAERARAGGVLSPDVATYLRQLGVPLRER